MVVSERLTRYDYLRKGVAPSRQTVVRDFSPPMRSRLKAPSRDGMTVQAKKPQSTLNVPAWQLEEKPPIQPLEVRKVVQVQDIVAPSSPPLASPLPPQNLDTTISQPQKPEPRPITEGVSSLQGVFSGSEQSVAKKSVRPQKKKLKAHHIWYGVATALIILVGYVSVDTLLTNASVRSEVAVNTDSVNASDASQEQVASDGLPEGVDKKQVDNLSTYTVAADKPRALYIDKLSVAARILPVGVKDGAVDSPKNIYDAGWYTGSSAPGTSGAAFIDGHSPETGLNYGLLANANKLVAGDEIVVEMGDGTKHTYKVAHKEIVPYDAVDMNKALAPYGAASEGLNIMSCYGKWIESAKTLDKRIILYAVPA